MNIDDLFGGFSDIFGGGRGKRGRDISMDIEITFKESIFGVERRVLLTKDSDCSHCSGSGAEPGSKTKTCPTCNGKGSVVESQRSPFGFFSVSKTCSTCHGKKTVPEKPCTHCRGSGVMRKEEEVVFKVPAGIDNGAVIRLSQMGEALAGGKPGDLYIKVHVAADKRFRRDGFNVITELPIKVSDALTGAEYVVETLEGSTTIQVPAIRSADEMLRLKGKGVPHGTGRRGDLLIKVRVEFPQKLSKEAEALIKKLRDEGV